MKKELFIHMPDISRHLFIMIYIIGFFLGIIQLTLNQIYISKSADLCYKKLQYYNWAFFAHVTINFIYFYGLYFYIGWNEKEQILFAVNVSIIAYLYFAVQMMQSFSKCSVPKGNVLLLAAGVFYIFSYSFNQSTFHDQISSRLLFADFILSEILLISVILYSGIFLAIRWASARKASETGLLIPVFSIGIIAYVLYNFYVDICFYYYTDKTAIWGINIYNLTVLYYVIINLISIALVYHRKVFLNALLENGTGSASSADPAAAFSPSTIADYTEKYHLSAREIEVLNLICRGMSNPDISCALFISNNTVKHHVNSIFKKVGVKNRYELFGILKN